MTDAKQHCTWTQADPMMRHYHDTVWDVPVCHGM